MTPRQRAARWRGERVLVIGDALLDAWMTGTAGRICREAPAPVVDLDRVEYACGGAANAAANLAALGAAPILLGATGDDADGAQLRECLVTAGVEDHLYPVAGRRTVAKRRLVADRQIVARIDDGDTDPLPAAAVHEICRELSLTQVDTVVVCDYDAGTLTGAVVDWIARDRDRFSLLIVDAHQPVRWRCTRPSVVTPNYAEIRGLLDDPAPGLGGDRFGFVAANAAQVLERTGAALATVTLDVDGSAVLAGGALRHRTVASPVPTAQTAGAGDAYVASLALALSAGAPQDEAADLAQRAATVATRRPGTAVCTLTDLLGATAPVTGTRAAAVLGNGRARRPRHETAHSVPSGW